VEVKMVEDLMQYRIEGNGGSAAIDVALSDSIVCSQQDISHLVL
jgi:hypothetical protein